MTLLSKKNRRRSTPAERAEQARAFAGRALSVSARGFAALALAGGVGYGALRLERWVMGAPRFDVREVRLAGNLHATGAELRLLAGISPGVNVFRADLAAACRRLEHHPWVREARATRRLPDVVELSVREFEPAALVNLGALYFVDPTGLVFKRSQPGDPVDVPVVTGISREQWDHERKAAQGRLTLALDAIDAYRRTGLAPSTPLAEVSVDPERDLMLVVGDGTEVRVGGRDALDEKLGRLKLLKTELARRGAHATQIDLDNRARPGWVAARLDLAEPRSRGAAARHSNGFKEEGAHGEER